MTSHAQNALIAKIKPLENEQKRVIALFHLLDDNIEILAKSLDILAINQNSNDPLMILKTLATDQN